MWQPPSIRLTWGSYFNLEASEKQAVVSFAQAALGKGPGLVGAAPLITRRQAVELIAPVIGIENVDAAMDALDQEAQDDADAALKKLQDQQKLMASSAPTPVEPSNKPDPKSVPLAAPPKK